MRRIKLAGARWAAWWLLVGAPITGCSRDSPPQPVAVTPTVAQAGPIQAVGKDKYVSSNACRSCHSGHYESWHNTYHRTMTQRATPAAVLGSFENQVLEYNGIPYRLQRRGDEFWVTTPDPDLEFDLFRSGAKPEVLASLPLVERRIVFTTGSHHMQLYWMASKVGRELLLFPWAYHIPEERWIPYPESVIVHPDAKWLPLRWNDNCIACHSVDGRPGRNAQTLELWSEVAEFGIACEACHGPGEDHVRRHTAQQSASATGDARDPTIVHPAQCDSRAASQICGQCHSAFTHDLDYYHQGSSFVVGGRNLEQSHNLVRFQDITDKKPLFHDLYWNDGTIRIGGREYLGLVETPCYQRGEMSCLSCHSMHNATQPNDLLGQDMDRSQACLQCHSEFIDRIAEHTHHAPNSSGSDCYNCHMPHTSYAFFTAIRSHRVDSPNTTNGMQTDRPHACNLCHLDKSLRWTSDHLVQWYDMPSASLDSEQEQTSAALLWLLKGDAVQRVVAAWHFGWEPARAASGSDWQAPFLAITLDDLYPATRFVTFKSLRKLPGYEHFDYDYVSRPEVRAEAVQRALEKWSGAAPRTDATPILLGSDGRPLWENVNALREKRDDRFIMLAE